MTTKKLYEIYETIGGINNKNKDFKNLSNEQFEWLLNQVGKINKLHFDLTQSQKIGGHEVMKINYLLSAIESDEYWFIIF